MKICIAQTKSEKGNVQRNIKYHLEFVERAIKLKTDLIIFPELSITNYEPDLAKELATDIESDIFSPFQEISNTNEISIGIGMPTKVSDGINISMLIFQPYKEKTVYSKQMLHSDELPYFICGKNQTFLTINGVKIAIGICYETLQREHFLNAKNQGTDIYIASVAKPKGGIEKAYKHFPQIANEFNTPILMSNCVGYCDNFISVGQSAVWNKKGELIEQLDDNNQGLLIYDTKTEKTEIKHCIKKTMKEIIIEEYTDKYASDVERLILEIQKNEFNINITIDNQPDLQNISNFYQVNNGNFWIAKTDNLVIGTISLLDIGNSQSALRKMFVHKNYRGKELGVGQKLLETLFGWANQKEIKEILLGTTEKFKAAQRFYEKNGFEEIKETDLPANFPVMSVDVKFYNYMC
mgnify:CR=1 FL=1